MRERLAELAHVMWSGWMVYLFSFGEGMPDGTFVMDADKVRRWKRQMNTPYAHLLEEEKESDRIEADRIIRVFNHE
jgi:hypothetical protein